MTGRVGGMSSADKGSLFDLGDVATIAKIGRTESERRFLGSHITSVQQRVDARKHRRGSTDLSSSESMLRRPDVL